MTEIDGPGGSPARRRVRMLVAYDGAGFHGFAANVGVTTVMGELTAAVERVVRVPVELTGAGRTDAGVHGWGQVVSGDIPASTDLADLAHRLTSMLGPAIVVRLIEPAPDDFDARFSASWREYRYHVWNHPVPHPLLAATAWHVPDPLARWALREGASVFVGEHDFGSFCRRPKVAPDEPAASLVRRVISTRWTAPDPDQPALLRFEIRGTSFCHQMVRSIVGTLVEVGRGRLHPGDLTTVLRARDRAAAGPVAPPHGLVLWRVGYPDGWPDHGPG
jgi:tRNA pseudouridine38-40 synthase